MGPTLAFVITTLVVVGMLILVIRAADRSHTSRTTPKGSDESSSGEDDLMIDPHNPGKRS